MLTITPKQAVKRMRELTIAGIPFSFRFLTYNSTTMTSNGVKHVGNSQLRQSYRDEQSNKSKVLVGYVDGNGKNRWFYLPLLFEFNGIRIKP